MKRWLKGLETAASFVKSTRNHFIQIPTIDVHIFLLTCDLQGTEGHGVVLPKERGSRIPADSSLSKVQKKSAKEGYRAGSDKPTDAGVRKIYELSKESKS